jgi:membrane protease YdiL (CAAX protease family)
MGKLRDQLEAAQVNRQQFQLRHAELIEKEARSDREQSLTLLLAGLAAFYLVVRFGATQQLDALGTYASYLFEVSLVAISLFLLRPKLSLKPVTLVTAFVALLAGFGIRKLAGVAGLSIPIDVHSAETVVFLLAVAPVLEELIFRFMIFKSVERVFQSRNAWLVSSLLFSYSHLHAIWFVPSEYSKFLIYQTAYTLPLALVCGWMVRRQSSLLSAMLVHATFNFGFYLAFSM